jgi:hypothetical protein
MAFWSLMHMVDGKIATCMVPKESLWVFDGISWKLLHLQMQLSLHIAGIDASFWNVHFLAKVRPLVQASLESWTTLP